MKIERIYKKKVYAENHRDMIIKSYTIDKRSAQSIADELGLSPTTIIMYLDIWGVTNRSRTRYKGSLSGAWKDGRRKSPDGYWNIYLLKNDPYYCMIRSNGYAREHRVVMARHLGRPLKSNEVVHHLNGIRDDNRIENLELIDRDLHLMTDSTTGSIIANLENKIKELTMENKELKSKLSCVI